MYTLTFSELRSKSVVRCEHDFHHKLDGWSVAEWGAATAGECGEACNVAKKMLRIRDDMPGNKSTDNLAEFQESLAAEIADLVIYADLWAASQGIDLGQAIIEKFNATSDKIGSTVKL